MSFSSILEASGFKWSSKLQFSETTSHVISGENLHQSLSDLIDPSQQILQVFIYRVPMLERFPFTYSFLNHQYVVFETQDWWWSIEKTATGLVLQRSRYSRAILIF